MFWLSGARSTADPTTSFNTSPWYRDRMLHQWMGGLVSKKIAMELYL